MSKSNLQGKNLDFNLSIITQGLDDKDITPIDTGVISYLEIEDSLSKPGVIGTVAIKNTFSIMDRLNTFRSTEKKLFLDVNIEDIDSKSTDITDRKISLSTMLENSSTITANINDNVIVFNFEESQTSMLKKMSMRKLWQRGSKPDKSPTNTLIGHIKNILNMWSKTLDGVEGGDLFNIVPDTGVGSTVNLQSYWYDIEDSVYDVLKRLVDNLQIQSSLPLFKIQNQIFKGDVKESVVRKFNLDKMFTDSHREFLQSRKPEKETGGVFNDVYMEEFVLAPQEDKTQGLHASGLYSTVEDYEIVKADIETARGEYWCDYMLNEGSVDLTNTNITTLDFSDIVSSFEEVDLGGLKTGFNSAIPVLQDVDKKILKADRVDSTDQELLIDQINKEASKLLPSFLKNTTRQSLLKDQINNRVKRSFLFLNDVIVFTTPGQMYRKSGTFITINGGDVIGKGAPYDIWFVVSVKHMFKELNYENEVVAVRLFGNSSKYKELIKKEVD